MAHDIEYWFPAKRYGWGWGPPTCWQGWTVLLLWMGAIAVGAVHWMPRHRLAFLAFNGFMIAVLLVICYLKGEPPRWRWGE